MVNRRVAFFATILAIGLLIAELPFARASTASDAGSLLASINRERTRRGIPALRSAGDLASIARRHSGRMAASRRIYHNRNLYRETSGWAAVGENVGAGPSASKVHNAFMRDAAHREIILSRRYTHVGVGVAYYGSTLYVTEVFALGSSAPAPKPRVVRKRRASRRAVAPPPPPPPVVKPPSPAVPVRSVSVMLRLLALDDSLFASLPRRP